MPNDLLPPSEAIGPELSDDRLQAIRQVIVKARNDKLALRQPQDVTWNLCCDCYIWVWYALREASQGPLRDWLYVPGEHGNLDSLFFIGGPAGVPAKFYRPDSPGQPERAARATPSELDTSQYALALEDQSPSTAVAVAVAEPFTVVRFAVDVRSDLTAGDVYVQKLNEAGTVVYEWLIPGDESDLVDLGRAARAEGVDLPEPMVELPEETEAREQRDRDEKKRGEENDKTKGA